MKPSNLAALALIALCVAGWSADVAAHGGGLDRYGCHNDRRNGGYHCHGGSSPGSSEGARRAAPRALHAPSPPSTDRDLVRSAQVLLNHLGCEAGDIDGGVGPSTRAAIARFNEATESGAQEQAIDSAFVLRLSEAVSQQRRCR